MSGEKVEIVPGLYVGDRYAAESLGRFVPPGWHCISVTEYDGKLRPKNEIPNEPIGSCSRPFMSISGAARIRMLDGIAGEIEAAIAAGKNVLVHCVQAHERSPLAIAWYLVKSKQAADLNAAYGIVCAKHPPTERRDAWTR